MSRKPQRVLEDLKIHTLGAKGKAIGKTEEGRVVFIPYVAPGDIVDARVVKKRKTISKPKSFRLKVNLSTELNLNVNISQDAAAVSGNIFNMISN